MCFQKNALFLRKASDLRGGSECHSDTLYFSPQIYVKLLIALNSRNDGATS